MSALDRYYERQKKKNPTSASDDEKSSALDRYYKRQYYNSIDTTGVDNKYIDTFANDADAFFNTVGNFDPSLSFNDAKNTISDIGTRYDTIRAWLYKNKNAFDPDYYTETSKSFDAFEEGFNSIKDAYSAFDDEESFNRWSTKYRNEKEIMSAEDFDEYSQIGANIKNPEVSELLDYIKNGGEIGNVVTMSRDNIANLAMSEMNGGSGAEYGLKSVYQHMEDNEVAIYNYYLGKGEKEKAAEYLESLTDELNQRWGGDIANNVAGNKFLELTVGGMAGLDNAVTGFRNLGAYFNGTEGDPVSAIQYASGQVRENMDGGWGVAYDLVNTTSNMLPSILVGTLTGGVGGAVTLGASAMGNAYSEMRKLGYGEWQSRGYGLLVGASEAVLSSVLGGISKLGGGSKGIFQTIASKFVPKFDKALARVAIQVGGNMLDEGLEEMIQEFLDPYLKMAATGEDFEAAEWEDILYSGLLGFLSAGALEGIPTIAGTTLSSADAYKISGGLTIPDAAKAFWKNKKLGDIATAYNESKQNRAEFTSALVNESLEIDPDNAHAARMKTRLDNGKGVSGYQINRLMETNESTMREQDRSAIQKAAAERLTALGETGDVAKLSKALTKYAESLQDESVKLTRSEENLIKKNENAMKVAEELGGSSDWVGKIGTNRINHDEYNKGITEEAAPTAENPSPAVVKAVGTTDNAPATEIATEGKIEASEGAKVTIKRDGKEVEVKPQRIASLENGTMTIELESGEVVDAGEINYEASGIGLVYDAAKDMSSRVGGFGIDTANTFVRGYDAESGQNAAEYIDGWISAYKLGALKNPPPLSALTANPKTASLTEKQRTTAYNFGKAFGNEEIANNPAKIASTEAINADKNANKGKKEGKVHFDGLRYGKKLENDVKLGERQRASLKALNFLAKALGVDIYVEEIASGENGWYDPTDRSIHIDLYAGAEADALMLFTAAHELTHHIREVLPDKFNILADAVFEEYTKRFGEHTMEDLIKKKTDFLKEKGRITENMTEEEAYDLAYEEVISDCCETMLTDSNAMEALSKNIYAKDKGLWRRIVDFFTGLVERFKAAYADAIPDSEEGQRFRDLGEGAERIKKLWVEAIVEASEVSDIADIDTNTESVAPIVYSERTWTKSEYVTHRDQMAEKISKALEVPVAKAKSYIDDINSIAKMIADDRARLDYEASSFGSAFVSNVEYGGSFDYTTLCKKRRIYTGTFTEIQKKLKDVALTPDDILTIRNMMIEEGIEATCGLCYVEGSRANMGKFAKEFIRLYKRDNPLAWIPNMADVNTPDGVEQMRISHPEAYDQYVYFWNHYGKLKDSDPALFASQQKPKLYEARKEYKGEILTHFEGESSVAKKNRNGGIRMQSFSDFEIVHLIDTMQVIMDMSTVGLAGQAYTKVPEFAKAFGNTGLKINLSLIAKGVDENGNLIFDDREGMPHKTAFELRDKYSKNVGTIIVTFTDEQLLAAMADPRIDFIIPFHRSQWKKGQYGAMGLPKGTKDYTYMQNEKLIKKTYHEYRGRMVLDKASNYMPNEYWDFSKSGKENAEAYLKMCAENNKRPKFYKLLDYDGKGTYSLKADGSTDGYWKLLIDFKMYDNEGVGSPQEAVTPTFNMDEAKTMLDEYKGGHSNYPVAHSVVDKFVGEYNKKNGTKASDRPSAKSDYVAKITADMTEEERYEALKKRSINHIPLATTLPVSVLEKIPEISSWEDINTRLGKEKRNLIQKLAKEFGVIDKEYFNEDIELSFEFSGNNFRESYNKQKHNYIEFAKMFSVFDSVIESAVGVEVHNRPNYKPDPTLDNVYVLMSAYQDGDFIIPVKLEIKKFKDKQNTLYVAISLEKIKKTEVWKQGDTKNGVTQGSRSVDISIADIFRKINPSDKDFLKYIPDGFLDDRQKAAKNGALYSDRPSKKATYSNRDSSYMDAVDRGDMEAAQKMVDEAATEAGYRKLFYHGTNNGYFTEFNTHGKPTWITENREYAELYSKEENSKFGNKSNEKIMPLYAKMENTLDITSVYSPQFAFEDYKNYEPSDELKRLAEVVGEDASVLAKIGKKVGATYVYQVINTKDFADLVRSKGYDSIKQNEYGNIAYGVLDSTQLKSADVVTYSKKENSIFGKKKPIPLSERFDTEKRDIRYQERTTNGMKPRSLLANALEGAVTEEERNLLRVYKDNIDMLNREQEKLDKVMNEIDEIQFKKSLSILGEEMSVATFERRAKAKAEKNGISVDEVQFKLDRSNAKYIAYAVGHGRILEADKTFRSAEDKEKLNNLYQEAKDISSQINTFDRELLNLQAMEPIKKVLQREKNMAYKRATEKAEQRRKESVERVKESAAKTEAKIKLQRLVLQTAKWISYPSKDDVKCPDIIRAPYSKFLKEIDFSSKRLLEGGDPTQNDERVANAMNNLANAIERITNAQNPSVDTDKVLDSGYLDLPVEFVSQLREMAEKITNKMSGDYVVNKMSATDVKQLSKLIRTLNHAIKEMSTLYANLRFANVEALGDNSMSFLERMGEAKGENSIGNFVAWDNALPYYAFKRFGEGGESIFEGLMDGQDKLARLAKELFDFKEKTWADKESKAWGEDTHTIDLPSGNSLTLTTANAMGIYCLSRRAQGLQHLLGGGTRVIGIKKGTKKASDSRSTLTQEDIDAIVASLTDKQKNVAEAIQTFMSTVCSEWGNEISMKRFLTKEFTDPNYYPIESNDENLSAKDPQAQQSDLYRLLNISATKPLVPGANNEVIIRNIFDVFIEHASDMAKLNAFGLPLLDYMKWANYREKTVNESGQITVRGVHKSMTTAYGDKAWSYVLNLIKDVNGRFNDNGDNSFLMNMMRMQKTASVGNNLRVAFLQFTSYPRASLVLSSKSLALGLTKKPQIEKAKKYCGIALWKSYGFYDTNIARSIEEQLKGTTNIRQKLIELTMKGPEWADAITWGALWNACEYEVAKTTKNKVGTEEFYQEVGLKLREVVYSTQVVDSILTRSQIMRSKSGLTQTATAYMSEPTLTANILMDAGFQFQREKRISGSAKVAWKKTGKIVGKAIGNYLVLQLITSIAESLADAWRDDDEEKFLKKFGEAFGENLITNLIPFNKIPIISDFAELLLSFFGIGFVSSDNLATAWVTQAATAVKTWSEVLGEEETSKTVYNAIYQTAKVISSVTGVSISGAMREVVAMWNNTAGAVDPSLKIRQYELTGEESRKALYKAILSGDKKQIESLEAEYENQSDINTAIRAALRENDPRIKEAAKAVIEGDFGEYDRLRNEIVGEGNFSEKNIKAAIAAEVEKMTPDEPEADTSEDSEGKAESAYKMEWLYSEITTGDTVTANRMKEEMINTHMANGKTRTAAEASFNKSFSDYLYDQYAKETLSDSEAKKMLVNYAGKTEDEAASKVRHWAFKLENPEYADFSESAVNKYYDGSYKDGKLYGKSAQSYGISLDVYAEYVRGKSGLSEKKDIMYVINTLPLSKTQKDALYYLNGWAKSSLYEAPWR